MLARPGSAVAAARRKALAGVRKAGPGLSNRLIGNGQDPGWQEGERCSGQRWAQACGREGAGCEHVALASRASSTHKAWTMPQLARAPCVDHESGGRLEQPAPSPRLVGFEFDSGHLPRRRIRWSGTHQLSGQGVGQVNDLDSRRLEP